MSDESRFFAYLRDRIGLDVASVGAPMIERAVQQRCKAAGQADLHGYWLLLQNTPAEQQALIEAVIVPETWFLRYPESFAALARLAQQRLAGLKGLRPLRLLSLPCSTGEEPYSIAMSLLDSGIAPAQFKVDAVDISPLSVAKAQRGVYGRNSFRGQDLSFRERHFQAVDDGYQLHQRVAAQVRLQSGNILDPALLAGEPPYDFVFCRNLLIYFDVPTQQRVFEVLKGFTQGDGALFIGPAEGSLLARMGMRPIGIPQSFAFVRHEEPAPVATVLSSALPVPRAAPLPPRPEPQPAARRRPPPAPLASVKAAPTALPADAAQLLAHIANLANEGRSGEAQAACETYLRQHPPQAQVYYWLGLLSDVAGNALQAQGYYRKALYLQPQHAEALAHLAMLLAAQGDNAGARRLQERAARSGHSADKEPR
ncbi:CheR family methyltransferase [Pseudomonas sp. HR96]|uniref:CheR family methyltransferase n=1 Tax=Pseudomonas sp. HR96 TaxID=1027966 RepID=UPI002A76617B|nr:CheR family methyltransferase [Pseudomonas sp. HR96]WPP00999.1 CheR family methyltransferase [Pseudomonas sp. HR96]